MKTLYLTPLAQSDMEEIWAFVASHNPTAADGLIDRIASLLELLQSSPQMGRLRPELAADLYSFPVEKYVVFYRIAETELRIIRVLHET